MLWNASLREGKWVNVAGSVVAACQTDTATSRANPTMVHACFSVKELLTNFLIDLCGKDLSACAIVCKHWTPIVEDILWRTKEVPFGVLLDRHEINDCTRQKVCLIFKLSVLCTDLRSMPRAIQPSTLLRAHPGRDISSATPTRSHGFA